jgi:hypothetical protein
MRICCNWCWCWCWCCSWWCWWWCWRRSFPRRWDTYVYAYAPPCTYAYLHT